MDQDQITQRKREIEEAIEQVKLEKIQALELFKQYKKENQCEYFHMYKWQKRAHEIIPNYNIIISAAPNNIGKTCLVVNIANEWCLGYQPWTREDNLPEKPGWGEKSKWVCVNNSWYRKSSLGIDPPVHIRVTGNDWKSHIGNVLIREFCKWLPSGKYETRSDRGNVCKILYPNGSSIEFLSHNEDLKLYESWKGHAWIPDEPPKKEICDAMSRGLFQRNGKVLMFTTPMEENWILDEFVEPQEPRYDVGIIDGLTFLDNDDLVRDETKYMQGLGFTQEQINAYFKLLIDFEDKTKLEHLRTLNTFLKGILGMEKFIESERYFKCLRFVKDTAEDNRETRFKGKFKIKQGLVFKSYKDAYMPDGHLLKKFTVPVDWPVTPLIDFHEALPIAINFFAVDEMNRHYCVNEVWFHLNPEEIADEIIRRKIQGMRINKTYIDPLSSGDNKSLLNRFGRVESAFTIIERQLSKHGIRLMPAPKLKESGIANIKSWLDPVNHLPRFFILDHCIRTRFEFKRYKREDDGSYTDIDDHTIENTYRYTLVAPKYSKLEKRRRTEFSVAARV